MTTTLGYLLLVATLAGFAVLGVTGAGSRVSDRDVFLSARASQGQWRLAASLFASGMGVWILFVPPEVGFFVGAPGVLGYAVAAAAPLAVLAWFGPRVRAAMPGGTTLSGWLRMRFGRGFQLYVGAVSVFYMGIYVTAELTAIGGAFTALTGGRSDVVIIAVAVATAGYTAYGGLPASLRTDRWQAVLIVGLIVVVVVAVFGDVGDVSGSLDRGSGTFGRSGYETAATLIIAVTAANLFHQGYWQRVWSANDDAAVRQASTSAAAVTLLMMTMVGGLGMIATGSGITPDAGAPLFALLDGLPSAVLAVVLVLALALVASSVDTLQNGIVALVASSVDTLQNGIMALFADDGSERRISLGAARAATVALTVPAAFVAVQGYSVLRLFLIADLVAAATIPPVLLGFTSRVTGRGAVAGGVGGVLAVVVGGWVTRGSIGDGIDLLTIANGALELGPFLWAPITATVVSLAVSAGAVPRRGTAPGTSERPSEEVAR